MKLYEIRAEYEDALAGAIDETTGEIKDERLADLLDEIEGKLEDKALDVAAYIVNLDAEAEAIAKRASELSRRAQALKNRSTSLTGYLAGNLLPGTKLADDRVAIGWRKSERCIVTTPALDLPKKWQRVEVAAATREIKDALKLGDPEARLHAHLVAIQNIQIR